MVNTRGGYWGCAVADHDNCTIIFTKKYYAFGQYTRYIRPGMVMLQTGGAAVAAYDPKGGRSVVVVCNTKGRPVEISIDLSDFRSVGAYASVIRTSNTENWKRLDQVALTGMKLNTTLADHSVTTFVIDGCKGNVSSRSSSD